MDKHDTTCPKSPNGEHEWDRYSDTFYEKGDSCKWCLMEIPDGE